MSHIRIFTCIVRWDVLREIRRKETLTAMVFFAILVLFLAQIGLGTDRDLTAVVGPVLFWIAILFSGTVGLSQSFSADREGNALAGIVTAPIRLEVYYLAKVAATWLYVMVLSAIVLFIYALLFTFSPWPRVPAFILVLGTFTLGYIAAGTVLAAMTTAIQSGGEVLLRILLFPLMIPLVYLALRVSEVLFDTPIADGALGAPVGLGPYFAASLAMDTMYLTAGCLLFPKVLEE
jgi:heme exporter protein B